MPLLSLVIAVLLVSGTAPQSTSVAPAPGQLRWARGIVTAVSPISVTLKLRDSTLMLALDPATAIAGAPAAGPSRGVADALVTGAVVAAHYTDHRGDRRVVLIVDGIPERDHTLSKRPGRSYRGTVERTRWGTLSLRVEGKKRGVQVSSDIPAGDITISSSSERALEIRKLNGVTP